MDGKKMMPAGRTSPPGAVDARISGSMAALSFRSRRFLKSWFCPHCSANSFVHFTPTMAAISATTGIRVRGIPPNQGSRKAAKAQRSAWRRVDSPRAPDLDRTV